MAVTVTEVLLDADVPDRPGDEVPVLYEGPGSVPKVYLAEGSKDWLWGLLLMGMSLGYLAWGTWWLLRRRRVG